MFIRGVMSPQDYERLRRFEDAQGWPQHWRLTVGRDFQMDITTEQLAYPREPAPEVPANRHTRRAAAARARRRA